jgi:cytochrome c oxidase subunit 1
MTSPSAAPFRICPVTGRTIHLQAVRLVKAYAVVAVVALLIGAIAALLLVLTRWQAVHLLPAVWYYRLLGVHGMNMLIFFIIYFEMAVLWFASTVLLNARPAAPKLGWVNFGLMLVGSLIVEWAQWSGHADVLHVVLRRSRPTRCSTSGSSCSRSGPCWWSASFSPRW